MKLMHVSLLVYHLEIDPKVADGASASANARHERRRADDRHGILSLPCIVTGTFLLYP